MKEAVQTYTPSAKTMDRYADVLVNFALGSGRGINKGDVVYLVGAEVTKPLFFAVRNAVIEAGGHVITNYFPDDDKAFNFQKAFYDRASNKQLSYFPEAYLKGLIDTIDHSVYLISDVDKESMKGVDPKKMMARGEAMKPFLNWRQKKEQAGKFSWTLCLYGTDQSAEVVGLSPRAYWNQIVKACYLDEEDPIAKWKALYKEMEGIRRKLNKITQETEKFHVYGKDADLWITPGNDRQWLCGRGANVPSFELFTSPDWRGTQGWIRFNHPLYRYGNIIKDIYLEFKNGKVVACDAGQGKDVIEAMIATKNADKLGEFSLTDKRHSRITKPMGETLYDENMGGKEGNTHVALGSAYRDAYAGDVATMDDKKAKEYGFNQSSVHTDIISTTRRTVVAHLKDGREIMIYDKGEFTL